MKWSMAYHEKFRQYDLGPGHPFRGDRFLNVMKLFEEKKLLQMPNLVMQEPKQATKQDLLRVHDDGYVNLIFKLAEVGRPYDIETPVSQQIIEAALLIIGGAIKSGEAVYKGDVNRAVALGCGYHHAGRNYGGGFCIFNDIAISIEYLREKHALRRVLIVDYDVHFGNGTSDIYYSDPNVLFISLHQDPRTIYPGTGFTEQIGKGAGEGYNINVPLPPGPGDDTYLYALREVFIPLAEEFEPELIIANGGSDPHFADLLGNLGLTVKGFFSLSRTIVSTAEKVCGGKVVLMPGSGYNPKVLPTCWYALVAGVADLERIDVSDQYAPPVEPLSCRQTVERTLHDLKQILKKYWKCFK